MSSEVGGTVTVINPDDRKIIGKVNFEIPGIIKEAIQPVGVRITKDDKLAFVALGPANRVAVVDTKTLKVSSIFWSGSASGTWPSRPTSSFC